MSKRPVGVALNALSSAWLVAKRQRVAQREARATSSYMLLAIVASVLASAKEEIGLAPMSVNALAAISIAEFAAVLIR